MQGITTYSDRIKGTDGNFNLVVRFYKTDGFVGISQYHPDGSIDRILLSRNQVEELAKFLGLEKKPRKVKTKRR